MNRRVFEKKNIQIKKIYNKILLGPHTGISFRSFDSYLKCHTEQQVMKKNREYYRVKYLIPKWLIIIKEGLGNLV